jgi:Protein of unknown function (DUF4238)
MWGYDCALVLAQDCLMVGKKQHYVPQFLLRNFSLHGLDGRISVYRISEGKHLAKTSIRDQAHENNFYGKPHIESSFAGLEGEAARIIGTAIREEVVPPPKSSDHDALLTFTLAQAFRTRAAADETNAMADRLAKRMMKDVPGLKEHLDRFKVTIEDAPLEALGNALIHIDLVRDLRYKLLCNRTAVPFISSDDPAVLYNQFLEPRKKIGSNTGLAVKGLQIFLPIGPKHLVMFFDTDVYTVGGRRLASQRVEVTAEQDVRALNLLQAVNASESVYFNDEITLRDVEGLARRAARYRPDAKASLLEYQPASSDLARDGVLIRMFTPDTRTHLRLGCVRLTPHATRYDFGHRVIHHRDPTICRIHKQFIEGVYAGKYEIGQFGQFLDDFAKRGLPPA